MSIKIVPSLYLVGASAITNNAQELTAFYSGLLPRLRREVENIVEPCRYVGYERDLSKGLTERFLGVETTSVTPLPEGMVGWVLAKNRLQIIGTKASRSEPLHWRWREVASNGRQTGEFCLQENPRSAYRMSANAYIDLKVKENDTILLTKHNPDWARQYAEMASELKNLPQATGILRLEHYGSTAIPGMPAKPVIDILMEVSSFDAVRPWIIPALNRENWEFWWYVDHMVFIRREAISGTRTHHVHVAPPGHRLWEGVAFRDYLRTHPTVGREYAELKHKLAEKFGADREGYTEAKTAFVHRITNMALT